MTKMPRLEIILPAAVLAALFVLITSINMINIGARQADTAVYLQAIENVARGGAPESAIEANVLGFVYGPIQTLNAQQLKTDPLSPPADAAYNELHGHEYFVLFPLGWLARVFPSELVLTATNVGCFIGLLGLVFVFVRRLGGSVVVASSLILLVIAVPAWYEGLLFGQFYPDRIFLVGGFALMALATQARANRALLIALALFCASIHERAAITAGLALAVYVVLYWRRNPDQRWLKLCLAIGMIVYGYIALKFLVDQSFYATYFAHTPARFGQSRFTQDIVLFLIVNLPLVIVACFELRAAIIAIVMMLPNVVGSIGGAEKIGWSTHYHSYYLPVLVWAAALGLLNLSRLTKAKSAPLIACALGFVFLSLLDVDSPDPLRFDASSLASTFLPTLVRESETFLGPGGMQYRRLYDAVNASVPLNVVVTAPEGIMATLHAGRTLRMLPTDIDHADYAILTITRVGNGLTYGGVSSTHGPADQVEANAVIVARMRADGYDFAHATLFPGLSLAIVRRKG